MVPHPTIVGRISQVGHEGIVFIVMSLLMFMCVCVLGWGMGGGGGWRLIRTSPTWSPTILF